MKKLLLIVALSLFLVPFAMAEDTGPADYDNDLGSFNNIRDYVGGHDHSYEQYDPKYEAGVGLDVIVYENKDEGFAPDEVTVENKYDFSNENGSVYLVAKYNLFQRLFGTEEE